MSIKALQDYTYYSKYARYNKEAHRRETWNEAVSRVEAMHLRRYPQAEEHIKWAFDLVRERRVLGSQRALQFGGEPIEKKHARIYNCISSYCDRIRFFQECFFLLLCGCGTGFSVQRHHIAKLPDLCTERSGQEVCYPVPDSIEGWADALGVLIGSYLPNSEFEEFLGHDVTFDFSQIRAEGSPLSSGVGKAPGCKPLVVALQAIRKLLDRCVTNGQKKLRPIDAYDIVMHASDAVLSGGVRRSASLCLFSFDDEEMAKAKTGDWFVTNPQRARSNNSALLIRNKTTKEQFQTLIASVKEFGEPGFVWANDTEYLVNPCCEIGLYAYDEFGNSGWQACNLSEINGRKVKCKEDFAIAARAAAIIGTLQAGYTTFDYLGEVTERIVRREALLGVSITGMMDNPHVLFDPKIQRQMAELVKETNVWFADLIGINAAARTTCVKPSGTASCVLGTSSGIHPHHAKRYLRRVQANKLEPVFGHFKNVNPHAVDKCVWSANGTDEVITFCIEVPDGAKTKNDLSANELLEYVKSTQQNWVAAGKSTEKCTKEWLTHNVSNTINVREDEWDGVVDFIYKNRQWFTGIALIPQSGDLDYPQAPLAHIHTPREILQMYGGCSILASGLIVDGLAAFDNNLWAACDTALGLREVDEKDIDKNDWLRRVGKFAHQYLNNDVRKCTYLLKEVNNWKQWLDLQREYKDVDYTTLIENGDNTKPIEEIACSGGKCELSF
jgi:ribonucleoside-diphosphate reductase alpha chain